jgi:uncharacterized protein (TIGR04255 family)
VTLRYVNNLELPFPLVDFSQYLNAPPNLPAELPLKVTRFLSRVSVVRESSSASAVITQAFEGLPGAGAKHVNVILDIDTSKREDFGNDDGVWAALEELHTFKNEIFFSSLTEAAVRLYE